jgi:DNA-binding NtrC family response regulator
LRERPDDIPRLVNFFVGNLREIYHRPDLEVTKAAMKWLKQLPLPGNIRQLKNLVERTVLVNTHSILDLIDFQIQWQPTTKKTESSDLPAVGTMTLEEIEIQMIRQAMKYHNGKVILVAKSLGLTRSALYRRLDKFQIPHDEDSV